MERTIKIIALALFVFAVTSVEGSAQLFKKNGLYSIVHDDWVRSAVPDGDVYTCKRCKDQVQIQINFGESLPRQMNEGEFAKLFDTEAKRKEFAESIVSRSIPSKDYRVDVYRTGMTEIGGIKVAQFGTAVEIGSTTTHDISMIGLHRNRIVKITLNYFDGAMTPEAGAAISKLYSSLRFE